MARYPTFEEYEKSGKYNDGLKRTNDLLKKNPKDTQLLVLKVKFLSVLKQNLDPTINELLAIQPPIQDLDDLVEIENALVESQRDDFPSPATTGPAATKFWDTATKAATTQNVRLDLLSLRFARAISHNRLADAQQALIQLKALLPKNRVIYMAHAAVTYLLSKEKGDMQARLALMLARKAVKDGFEKEDPGLDCRVPGQIFAGCGEVEDLGGAEGTRYGESKQVYEALRRMRKGDVGNGDVLVESSEGTRGDSDSLQAQLAQKKEAFKKLIETNAESPDALAFAAFTIQFFAETTKAMPKDDRKRIKADASFLSISALIHLFSQQRHNESSSRYLLLSAYLAETLLQQDENIHEARMILVYLYMRLNLGSLALQMFHSLRVKEIQNDTVGHALFTRISLTLPFTTGETKTKQKKVEALDPKKMATNALAVYERCGRKLRETEAAVLSHGQTGILFDLEELSASLRTSVTRRIIHLEQRRLARLVDSGIGEDASLLGPRVTANWLTTTNNRDLRATFDFGCEVERVLYGDGHGNVPGRGWVLRTLVADAAWCLALGKEAPVIDLEALFQEAEQLDTDLVSLQINDDEDSKSGSTSGVDAEVLASAIATSVLKMLMRLGDGNDTSDGDITPNVNAIRDAICRIPSYIFSDEDDDSRTSTSPAASLRDFYTFLDILCITGKAASAKVSAASADALSELKKLAQMKRSQLQTRARVQRDSLSPSKVRAVMVQHDALAEAIAPLNEVRDLGAFCEAIALSAREGWDGVGKVK